jgi:hypothetical protein
MPPAAEGAELTWQHPCIASTRGGAASFLAGETSQSITLASDNATVETVKESPTDAPMRVAGVDRVILGSDGRSNAWVSIEDRNRTSR